jgi:hypothetical protein
VRISRVALATIETVIVQSVVADATRLFSYRFRALKDNLPKLKTSLRDDLFTPFNYLTHLTRLWISAIGDGDRV